MTITDSKQARKEQRQVATQISIVLADLTVNHGIELEQAIELCRNALDKAHWGLVPDGHMGVMVEVE